MKKYLLIAALFLSLVSTNAYADVTNETQIAQEFQTLLDSLQPPAPKAQGRIITFRGEVDERSSGAIISQIEELNKQGSDEIELDITSPGGSVYAGLGIIDAMDASKAPIKTVCKEICMSMAAFILAHGKHGHRFSYPHATILIHQLSSQNTGTLKELDNQNKEGHRLQDMIYDTLQKDTGQTRKDLEQNCSFDHYMSPKEALDLGIIDNIIQN